MSLSHLPNWATTVAAPQTELAVLLFLLLVLALAIAVAALLGYRALNHQLSVTEQRQRVVIDSLGEGLITLDSHRRIRDVNQALQDMFGWRRTELLGKHIELLLPVGSAETVHDLPPLPMVSTTTQRQVLQATGQHKDGQRFPVHLTLRRITIHGQPHHVGIITDASTMLAMHKTTLNARSELDSFVSALNQHSIFSATDLRGTITHANAAFCAISGYSTEELIGRQHSIVNSGTHPPEFWQDMWRTIKNGQSWHAEVCNRAKDGHLYWVDSLIVPVINEAGHLQRIISIRHDITERKTSEQKLLHTQKLLDLSNEAAHIGTWEVDLITNKMQASAVAKRLLDVPTEEAEAKGLDRTAYLVKHTEALKAAYERAIHEGIGWDLELLVRKKQDTWHWVRSIGLPELENGKTVGFFGIVQDIDAIKRHEQELADEKWRLTTLIESNRIGIWEYYQRTKKFHTNAHLVAMLGLEPKPMVVTSEDFYRLVHPDDLSQVYSNRLSITDRTDSQLTFRMQHQDGHWVWVQMRSTVLQRDESGQPAIVYGATLDVSELMQARLEAESAVHSKDQFIATMSHELRTPLNAILGFGQLLDIDDSLNIDQRDNVQEILKASHHLLDLINDVLDLARINAGRMEFQLEAVSLSDVLNDCCTLMQPLAQAHGLRLQWPRQCAWSVRSDRRRLKQVLINLLSNAVKYNRPAGLVTVIAEPTDSDRVRLEVIDTGPGIPAEQLAQLFQPFQRLTNAGNHIEGSGIGLNITQQLVERMGGRIGVNSVMDVGSTFWFELPLQETAPTDKPEHLIQSLQI